MATEDREVMEARGAGESCPTLSKVAPGDNTPEGKPKASLEAEPPKLEESETCEDRDCPGSPKSQAPKSSPTTKGQAGDGPGLDPTELPLTMETEHHNAMELEKVRMEFELTRLKYLHQENERQRQHEEVMEQLQQQQQQALPRQFSGGLQDLLLPQNQFAMFLYCFIFIHIIYVTKEMVFFLFSKHYLFCLAAILLCLIKTLWSYFQVPLLLPSPATSSVDHQIPPFPWQPGLTTQLPAADPSVKTHSQAPALRLLLTVGLCLLPKGEVKLGRGY